jgi:uncharacterized membrane protein
MTEENKVSDEAVVDNGTENATQDNAQNEFIAESKKYRKRAQEAETQLATLEKKLQSQENAKLKEKEEFKTLAEKFEAEVDNLSPYKDKYEALVEKRKTSLLDQLPEDKREQFNNKDLDVLEFMVSELASKTPVEPQARGTVKSKAKPLSELTPDEKKANWGQILNSYIKK